MHFGTRATKIGTTIHVGQRVSRGLPGQPRPPNYYSSLPLSVLLFARKTQQCVIAFRWNFSMGWMFCYRWLDFVVWITMRIQKLSEENFSTTGILKCSSGAFSCLGRGLRPLSAIQFDKWQVCNSRFNGHFPVELGYLPGHLSMSNRPGLWWNTSEWVVS